MGNQPSGEKAKLVSYKESIILIGETETSKLKSFYLNFSEQFNAHELAKSKKKRYFINYSLFVKALQNRFEKMVLIYLYIFIFVNFFYHIQL